MLVNSAVAGGPTDLLGTWIKSDEWDARRQKTDMELLFETSGDGVLLATEIRRHFQARVEPIAQVFGPHAVTRDGSIMRFGTNEYIGMSGTLSRPRPSVATNGRTPHPTDGCV